MTASDRASTALPLRALLALVLSATPAMPQGTGVAFGELAQNTGLPVEVASDALEVDQADGSAVFTGNVLISQGDMRMTAGAVRVDYAETGGGIDRLEASGGVTLVSGTDAAEAREAVYGIDTGTVVMSGDVILTQGRNALSSERLVIDLVAGTGRMEGRVRTVLQTGSAPDEAAGPAPAPAAGE